MTLSTTSDGFCPTSNVTLTARVRYDFPEKPTSLGFTVVLPSGWSFLNVATAIPAFPQTKPSNGATGTLNFAWGTVPSTPASVSFIVKPSSVARLDQTFTAHANYALPSGGGTVSGADDTLVLARTCAGEDGIQSSDQDGNFSISLSELLRVIQFYNSGGLHCASPPDSTEDGFAPGPGADHTCLPYDTDYNPQDWAISLSELLRVIQFYNSGAYHYCPASNTEDGFCPGA